MYVHVEMFSWSWYPPPSNFSLFFILLIFYMQIGHYCLVSVMHWKIWCKIVYGSLAVFRPSLHVWVLHTITIHVAVRVYVSEELMKRVCGLFFAEVWNKKLAEEEKKETVERVWWRDELSPRIGIIKEGKMEEVKKRYKTSITGDGEERHTGNSK